MSFTGLHLRKRIRRRVVRIIDRLLHLLDEDGAPAATPAADPSYVRPTEVPNAASFVRPTDAGGRAATPSPPASTSPTLAPPAAAPAPSEAPPAAAPEAPPAAAPEAPPAAAPEAPPAAAPEAPPAAAPETTPAAAPEAPPAAAPAEPAAPRPARPKRPATPALPPLPQPETPIKVTTKETPAEKQKKHWERARRGVLRFVLEKGGQATLRELHEHSESTYFIAHVSFSRLMEELTGEKLLDYDHDTANATLTEAGRAILT
jgi:hypothetical protein